MNHAINFSIITSKVRGLPRYGLAERASGDPPRGDFLPIISHTPPRRPELPRDPAAGTALAAEAEIAPDIAECSIGSAVSLERPRVWRLAGTTDRTR
jgi:hypothetical protein